MSSDLADRMAEMSMDGITEYFLIAVVMGASAVFLGLSLFAEANFVSLSTLYYGIIPVSLALILLLTFDVMEMLYKTYQGGSEVKEFAIAIVIAVASLNLGFMTVISSSPTVISGATGITNFILLVVLLSFGLSISLLTRSMGLKE
jgi:hypothetical protein